MNIKQNQPFILSPEWSIRQNNKQLHISGGADITYEIELKNNKKSFFSSLKPNTIFYKKDLVSSDLSVFEELLTAKIIVPKLTKRTKKLKILVIGDKSGLFELADSNKKNADIIIITRTISTYASLLSKIDYQGLRTPHLFVDLAFHHTISIGPLVFPGYTACVACLQGRIGDRWGDAEPPNKPKVVSKYTKFATELVNVELDKLNDGDVSLVGETVSWDLQSRSIQKNQLLKVQFCPICSANKSISSGSFVLPWSENEGSNNSI